MTTVQNILDYLETIAPANMKMDWDNVGLLCGSPDQKVSKILIALDPFESICREAAEIGADLLVTHHPLIFQGQKAITDQTGVGKSILHLIRNNISAVNAHTNLDCAPGGVNDVLAEKLGLNNIQVVTPAGITENGKPWGLLRCGTVDSQPLSVFLSLIKEQLGCEGLRYVDSGKIVNKVAVGGGSCGDCIAEAVVAGCDTFVTADIKYNQFWDAKDLGINLIDAGHFYTENPVIPVIAQKLQEAFPEITVKISETHTDCMKFY